MKVLPSDLSEKLALKKQTRANEADPASYIWVNRPTTPLVDSAFLEKQTVSGVKDITDADIAVCHPKAGNANTGLYMAYVSGGKVRVTYAVPKLAMQSHVWQDQGFEEDAEQCAIAFDGKTPIDTFGNSEFVTERLPWIFWVHSGKLYGQHLNGNDRIELATKNVEKVSAVRATWNRAARFNFGLIVFFIVNGYLYYRQLIDGVWYDAELVSFVPAGTKWVDISACRTWDYRIVVQAKNSSGAIFELFTQFEGIGSRNEEHLDIYKLDANVNLQSINYVNESSVEHLEIGAIDIPRVFPNSYGLYKYYNPEIVRVYNIATTIYDETTEREYEDYGIRLVAIFDRHLVKGSVEESSESFKLIGTDGVIYPALAATLAPDGMTVTIEFNDFNNAGSSAVLSYTPGTMESYAGYMVEEQTFSFEPENLVPSSIPVPEVLDIWNG